jgi:hypothetical protein
MFNTRIKLNLTACRKRVDFVVFSLAPVTSKRALRAGVAQLVEQLICNHQVGGSNPFTGSIKSIV